MAKGGMAGRLSAGLATAILVAGCGGSASPSPLPTDYTLDFPEGWTVGSGRDQSAIIAELEKTDSEWARQMIDVLEQSAATENEIVAYHFGSGEPDPPNVSCNTVDRQGITDAELLDLGQQQNLEGLAQMPGITADPTADRVSLPVGETVRIRWQWQDVGSNSSWTSVGYLFPAGPFSVTCVFSARTDTVAEHEPEWEAILATFELAATVSTTSCEPVLSHEATELESLLPASVQGRDLARWSVRGRCWLEQAFGPSEADIEEVVAAFENPDDQQPIDLANLAYGVAGRSDTSQDPPYFVFAATRPWETDENDLALYLFFGVAGFDDVASGPDLSKYEERTVADKTVYVGTTEMLDQNEHQRGRPYLYQTDDYMFMILAEDEAWATDALAQLP